MRFHKKNVIRGVLATGGALIIIAGSYSWYQYRIYKNAMDQLTTDELKGIYADALDREAKLKKEITFDAIIGAGFKWKSLGDATQNDYFYKKAIVAYEKGVKNENARSSLFFLNAGNIYKAMGKFQEADDQYKQAINLDTGNEANHIARIEMYMYWKDKTQDDVLYVIDEAAKVVLANGNINLLKAEYLSNVGRYEEALRTYEALLVVYSKTGNSAIIKSKIEELQRKIQVIK